MNRILIITSIVTAAAVLIYTVFAGLQWWAIRKQGDYASQQVGKMQEQLGAIKEQARIMGESLAETRTIVAHNERAVMAAEQGLEIAQDNTIYAQRAYVSITRGTVSGNCFDLMIENSGNTPSSDTQMRCAVELRPGAPELPVSSEQPHEYTYIGLIAPHGLFSTQQRTAAEITPAQYRQIAAEEIALWCYGEIMYVDTFGRRRHTRFCFHQETGSSALQPWVEGNEAD